MESSKDKTLRNLFMRLAGGGTGVAGKVAQDGEVYLAVSSAIWKGPPDEKEDVGLKDGDVVSLLGRPTIPPTAVGMLRPEVFLDPGSVEIPARVLDSELEFVVVPGERPGVAEAPCVYVGYGHTDHNEHVAFDWFPIPEDALRGTPIRRLTLPGPVSEVAEEGLLKDMRVELMRATLSGGVALVLTGDASMLCVMLLAIEKDPFVIGKTDLPEYEVSGWNQKLKGWKNIKQRKKRMKGLINPLVKKEDAAQVVSAASVVAEADQSDPSVLEAVAADVSSTAVVVEEKVEETASEPVAEQPAPAASQAQPKKRSRPSPAAVGLDLAKVIESLSSPVEAMDAASFDKALEELRQLRDLQIATARRAANIAIEMHKFSIGAVGKYEAMKALLK